MFEITFCALLVGTSLEKLHILFYGRLRQELARTLHLWWVVLLGHLPIQPRLGSIPIYAQVTLFLFVG
jgi:hypothetical protein